MVSNFASTSGDCWQRLRDQLEHSWSRVRGGNQEYLLYHLMDQTVDTLVPVVDEVLKHLAALETQLIEANSNDLNNFKQQLGFAHRMLRPMREVLNTTHSISSGEIKKYLKDIHSHINSLLEDVEAGIEQCRDLITHYDTKIANKQANVLYLLTFVTILLCPIQVMSGVYGMNFVNTETGESSMPELNWKHGYTYFWATSLTLIGILSLTFKFIFHWV
eukprot:FR738468.1.p1 GENE.FR738468.1~~FR738468.1.p1  ORF type:complete len:230 (+),score=15.56 FR738468.1:39-692(+)